MTRKTDSHSTLTLTACALLGLLLAGSAAAGAATLSVCASGCDYSTIQGAVDAASDGDTIQLSSGTYTEGDIYVDVDVTIETSSGRATIDGDDELSVFEIDADAVVTLEDLSVENATRAMLINHGNLTLRTVYVTGDGTTDTTYGGIVNYGDAYLKVLEYSVVQSNVSSTLGGGITNFGDLEIDASTLIGNEGRLGGGFCNSQGTVSVTSSSISGNHATVRGGGYANVHVSGGTVAVLSSTSYSSNTADVDCDKYYDVHKTPSCVN